jgi:hypothetical protein
MVKCLELRILVQHPISIEALPSPLSSRLPRLAVGPERSVVEGPAVLTVDRHRILR